MCRPTFYQIYKKKSTEGFQSLPYVVALFSAMLWIYYAFVKREAALLLITINTFGIVVESAYLIVFLLYAPKKSRVYIYLIIALFFPLFLLILFLFNVCTKIKKN